MGAAGGRDEFKAPGEGHRICANLATLTRPSGGLSQRERRALYAFTELTASESALGSPIR
jgi:hypothetical protein